MLRTRLFRQTANLYFSELIVLGAGFFIAKINTSWLEPAGYGVYSLCFAIAQIIEILIHCGFFMSGSRLLALHRGSEDRRRAIIGLLILVGIVLGLAAGAILFALSYVVGGLFDTGGEEILRWFAFLFGLSTIQIGVEAVCRGTERIGRLAVFQVASRVACVVVMGIFVLVGTYNIEIAVSISLLAAAGSAFATLLAFSPRFTVTKDVFKELIEDVRTYGFNAYVGGVANNVSHRFDAIFISYFVGTAPVGFYRLSALLTTPAVKLSHSLATSLFVRLTTAKTIDPRVTIGNFAWLASCLVGLSLLGPLIVEAVFGEEYAPVVPLIVPMALAALITGMGEPYIMFLRAKGKGRYMRNFGVTLSVMNIVLHVLLIPTFGLLGACYAALSASVLRLALLYYYYRTTVAELSSTAA